MYLNYRLLIKVSTKKNIYLPLIIAALVVINADEPAENELTLGSIDE